MRMVAGTTLTGRANISCQTTTPNRIVSICFIISSAWSWVVRCIALPSTRDIRHTGYWMSAQAPEYGPLKWPRIFPTPLSSALTSVRYSLVGYLQTASSMSMMPRLTGCTYPMNALTSFMREAFVGESGIGPDSTPRLTKMLSQGVG